MSETDWLTALDPEPMLAFLARRACERELRLFHCACCWRIWRLIVDQRGKQAVDAAEAFAEGRIGPSELLEARRHARLAVCAAKRAEWIAEADADFCYAPEHQATVVKLYALCAAKAAVSDNAYQAHGGYERYQEPDLDPPPWEGDPIRPSHYWAKAAVGEVKRAEFLAAGKIDVNLGVEVTRSEWLDDYLRQCQMSWHDYLVRVQAKTVQERGELAEKAAQADLVRRIFGNPFSNHKDELEDAARSAER